MAGWKNGPPKAVKVRPPHGSSQKTLTYKVPKKAKAPAKKAPAKAAPVDLNGQPITPGSSITRGDANRQAANAVTVRYGPQGQALNQNYGRTVQQGIDQQGWYQQYLDALKGYQTSTQDRATAANTQVTNLSDSIRGIDQQTADQTGKANTADAANRGASVDPQLAKDASHASVVRQALQGSFGALIAAQGRSAGDRAANLAQVVGPGQKLQAQAQNARSEKELLAQIASLKGQSGAYKQQFLDSLTQSEAKNVLAASIASGKDLTAQARVTETTRHNKASEKNTAAGQTATANANAGKVNAYGYSDKDWRAMSVAQRQKVIKDFKATGGKKPKVTSGPGSLTPIKEASIVSQIHQVIAIIEDAPRQVPVLDENGKPKKDSNGNVMTRTLTDSGIRHNLTVGSNPLNKVIDPRIVNIAFDIARKGGLSAPNVRAAQNLGIHVNGHFKILKAGHKLPVKGMAQQQSDIYKNVFGAQ